MVEQGGPNTLGRGGTAIDARGLSELINLLMDIPAGADVPLADIAARLAQLFAVDIMVIYDVDQASSTTTLGDGFGISLAEASDGLNREAILAAAAAERTVTLDCPALPPQLVERGVRAGACVPFPRLSVVLVLYRHADVDFDAAQIEFISLVAKYVNLVLRRMRRAVQLRRLAEHSIRVGACRSERAVLDVAVDGIPRLFEADAAGVGVISDGTIQFGVHRGFGAMFDHWTGTIEQSAVTAVVRERRPHRTRDIREGAPERSFWPIRAAVIAPVEVNGTVVAVLGAYRYTTRQFGTDDEYVLTVLAGQVAAAMSNATLLAEREQLRRDADTLRVVSAEFNSSLNVAEVGRRVQAAMLDHSGAERVVVLLLDEDQRLLHPMVGASGRSVLAEDPVVVRALLERRPIMQELNPPPSTDGVRWSLVQPLAVHDRRLGVVLLEWAASSRPAPPARVETIADMAARALEHAQLFEHAMSSGRQLTALHDVAVAMSNDDDIASTLARVVDSVRAMTGAQVARIGLVDPSGDTFTTVALSGEGDRPLGTSSPMSTSVGAWVIQNGTTAWVPNTAAGLSEPAEAAAWIHDHTPGSAVAVPIHGRGDAPVTGFLTLRHPEPHFLGRSYLPILERFATEAGLAVQAHRETDARLALARQLQDQAAADPLTGLANRTHLLEAITQALAAASRATRKRTVAVLFLDLDRFKTVNDSLGHAAGDELLCAVGDRISSAVRPGDLVGRLG
ncbi:MAG: GAF domain-containing protein, partial [Mycobacteriaceae bacterium]